MGNRGIYAFIAALVLLLGFSSVTLAWWPFGKDKDEAVEISGEVTEITWEDLIPDDFVPPRNPFETMTQEQIDKLMDGSDESNAEIARLQKEFSYAPVVPGLDGQRVKIPAYVTPLEYNEDAMSKEFLLVPYVGACIHVPPPPANQIVHVKSEKALRIPNMYEAIWAIGTIRAETITSDLAESGYWLDVEKVMPYEVVGDELQQGYGAGLHD